MEWGGVTFKRCKDWGKKLINLKIFLLVYLIWNLYVMSVMRNDKHRAKKHMWRVPELTLLLLGIGFGGFGLYTGMKLFHHKTSHLKFVVGVPIIMLLNIIVIGCLYYIGIII